MQALIADSPATKKSLGSFYTPPAVANALVRWVVKTPTDRLLDPACGDGRFLAAHSNVVGVDRDVAAVAAVAEQHRHAIVHAADFFEWASQCKARFDCVAGNPPFIRYQTFNGAMRKNAIDLCRAVGVKLTGLASSWAPFVIVAASLLKRDGRLAFVVPAEIGHAPYARSLLEYLLDHFSDVHVLAIREKVFPELSEDVWFVYAAGFGGRSSVIRFSAFDRFDEDVEPLVSGDCIDRDELESWDYRLRPFLLPRKVRDLYRQASNDRGCCRLRECARVGIGYVTGANDFFHLRPSVARSLEIPDDYLMPSVRRSAFLPKSAVTRKTVQAWLEQDQPILLLKIPPDADVPDSVRRYLDSDSGRTARTAYKCRVRSPWYSVPDVRVPDAFLGYMSGLTPSLVANSARCACTNSVHAVHLTNGKSTKELLQAWSHPLVELSCELEGHPLGGGMLKLEPREAGSVLLPLGGMKLTSSELSLINEGIQALRRWRHYA